MLIDGFTVFGSWPGIPQEHPVEHLLSGLERFKLDKACTLSTSGIYLDAASGNTLTWETCQRDQRLIPIGTANPLNDGVEQVDFCKERGFRLMALFPRAQGWRFHNLAARKVLDRIAIYNLPVLIETPDSGDISELHEIARHLPMPIILLDVSPLSLMEALAATQTRVLKNPYIEALKAPITEALSTLVARPETYLATRLLCGGDTIEYAAKAIGAEHLIFTSRFPISCFSASFLTAKFANLSDNERRAVMGENMSRLLA